jgi:hypothetical protein
MAETAISALAAAWVTTVIAMTLFVTALAFARIWDTAVYLRGLTTALGLDP